MEITLLKMTICLIVLFILPVFMGSVILHILKLEKGLAKSYVFGFISIWAFCQIITVPLVLLKADFRVVFGLMTCGILGMVIYSLCKKSFPVIGVETQHNSQKVALATMLLVIGVFLSTSFLLQHTDADDSRFVVNAVDIIRTNTMYLTNPATGEFLGTWAGELIKDVTAPWAVYIACLSKMTGIHPTIMAHTLMPISLLLMACCVFWLLSKEFFDEDITSRCIFVVLVILLNIYGHYSLYSAETFLLTRIWQGKAVVASIGIPVLLLEFLWIYKQENKKSLYCLVYITQFALCLLSGMGIIIGAIMAGCYGLVYGIAKRNWKIILAIWVSILPNVMYYVINECL